MSKKNWNDLTEKEQKRVQSLVDNDVLHLCNELITTADVDDLEFYDDYEHLYDDGVEIMQYFIVTDYLLKELNKIGAIVLEYKGLNIWGRTEYGQALDMDKDLKKVAIKMEQIQQNFDDLQKENQDYLSNKYGFSK